MKTAPKVVKAKANNAEVVEQKEPTVKVLLTAQQFNVIMAGLGELPHKHVGNLINDLVAQVQPQINSAVMENPKPANEE